MKLAAAEIYRALAQRLPHWEVHDRYGNGNLSLEYPSPAGASLGGLVVQTTDEGDIWLRNYHPYSAAWMESVSETLSFIEGILADKIVWVIATRHGRWYDTELAKADSHLTRKRGIIYKTLSWSGALDTVQPARPNPVAKARALIARWHRSRKPRNRPANPTNR